MQFALDLTTRQVDYLRDVAAEPNEIDAHNDMDTIVELLRSMAMQVFPDADAPPNILLAEGMALVREAKEAGRESEYMADPVMVCPRCAQVVELEPGPADAVLRPGENIRAYVACPGCGLEMRWSEWDLTVQERPDPEEVTT